MLRLADIVRRHGPSYLDRHGAAMIPSHRAAVKAILHCRTPAMGGHLGACDQCGYDHLWYHSCRNRACSRCGRDATERWLGHQREQLLPVPYYHVVFTLPSELRRFVRAHQTVLLPVLFQAAYTSLAKLAADKRYLGALRIGALAVLHTWTRTLEWHPHIHMLVPGGGLAADGRTWLSVPNRRARTRRQSRSRFFVPVRALAKLFRGRFLALARRALPGVVLPSIPWSKPWVVFAKPVVQGADKVLDYLGRYVHKTAITDSSLVSYDERVVTFRYRDSADHQLRVMTLPAHEFLRRFLQHVLPKGFHRVRAFGLLHPAHRATLHRLQLVLVPRPDAESPEPEQKRRLRPTCPRCKQGTLRLVRLVSKEECLAFALRAGSEPEACARAPP